MTVRRYVFHRYNDSLLNYPNQRNISVLELIVKVHLNPFNPGMAGAKEEQFKRHDDAPGDGKMYTFQTWNPGEWNNFKAGFKREVEFYLNWPLIGLWFRPKPAKRRFPSAEAAVELQEFIHSRPLSLRFGAVVQCGLTVNLVDSENSAHAIFDVMRLRDDQPFFRSYAYDPFFGKDRECS